MTAAINLFTYLLEHWYVILLIVSCGLNYKNKVLFSLTLVVTFFSLMSIVVWNYVLLIPDVTRWFYVFWAAWDALLIFAIIGMRIYFKKHIIKQDIVVLILSGFNVSLQLIRYIERHYFGTGYTNPLYEYGMMIANAIIMSTLFFPGMWNLIKTIGEWLHDRFITVKSVNYRRPRHLGD